MTESLQKAFEQAAKLPQDDQEWLAGWIVEIVESEQRWNELFAKSQDMLAQMADEALEEHRARRG